jgi:hypothetical protein
MFCGPFTYYLHYIVSNALRRNPFVAPLFFLLNEFVVDTFAVLFVIEFFILDTDCDTLLVNDDILLLAVLYAFIIEFVREFVLGISILGRVGTGTFTPVNSDIIPYIINKIIAAKMMNIY